MDAAMAARYGLPTPQAQPRQRPRREAEADKGPEIGFKGDGRWKRSTRGRYQMTAGSETAPAVVKKNHRVYISTEGLTLVFGRVY